MDSRLPSSDRPGHVSFIEPLKMTFCPNSSVSRPTLSWNNRFGQPPAVSPTHAILQSMTPAAISDANTMVGFLSVVEANIEAKLAFNPDSKASFARSE